MSDELTRAVRMQSRILELEAERDRLLERLAVVEHERDAGRREECHVNHDLVIDQCGRCPFAGFSGPDTGCEPVCKAAIHLDPENREWFRPFGVRVGGITIFPSPPPDWCPLRIARATIRVPDAAPAGEVI